MKKILKRILKGVFRFCIKYPFVFFVVLGISFSLDYYKNLPQKEYVGFIVAVWSFVVAIILLNLYINYLDNWIKELLKDTKYYRKRLKEYREALQEQNESRKNE